MLCILGRFQFLSWDDISFVAMYWLDSLNLVKLLFYLILWLLNCCFESRLLVRSCHGVPTCYTSTRLLEINWHVVFLTVTDVTCFLDDCHWHDMFSRWLSLTWHVLSMTATDMTCFLVDCHWHDMFSRWLPLTWHVVSMTATDICFLDDCHWHDMLSRWLPLTDECCWHACFSFIYSSWLHAARDTFYLPFFNNPVSEWIR